MGWNRFLDPHGHDTGETPRRLYARLDDASEQSLLFDAIDADWLEGSSDTISGFGQWQDRAAAAPVYVLEMFGDDALRSQALLSTALKQEEVDFESPWYQVELGQRQSEAMLYSNLFGEGRFVFAGLPQPVGNEMARKLDRIFSLDPYVVPIESIERGKEGGLPGAVDMGAESHAHALAGVL